MSASANVALERKEVDGGSAKHTLRYIIDSVEHPGHHHQKDQAVVGELWRSPLGRRGAIVLPSRIITVDAGFFCEVSLRVCLRGGCFGGAREARIEGVEGIQIPDIVKQRHDILASQMGVASVIGWRRSSDYGEGGRPSRCRNRRNSAVTKRFLTTPQF